MVGRYLDRALTVGPVTAVMYTERVRVNEMFADDALREKPVGCKYWAKAATRHCPRSARRRRLKMNAFK
jgi:hypothetical protein